MSKSKPIPETAGEMVKRARAGGAEVTEHLIESWCGMIGHVKIRKPGEPRAFLVIYVSEPRIMGKRRQVAYVESSGPIPQRSADRALRVVLRQMRDEREADELAAAELREAELRQRDLGHGDILLRSDIGPSLLTCDGEDGCGATYVDAMQHTQGDHDKRRADQLMPPVAGRVYDAADRAGFIGRTGKVSFSVTLPGESPILVAYRDGRTYIAQDGPTPIPLKVDAVLTLIREHARLAAERAAADADEARWRSYRAVRDRAEAAMSRLQLMPIEVLETLDAAWERAMRAPGSDVPNQEIVMTALAAELQIRLDSLAADPHAGLTPSEIGESPARGCCGHVCKRLN